MKTFPAHLCFTFQVQFSYFLLVDMLEVDSHFFSTWRCFLNFCCLIMKFSNLVWMRAQVTLSMLPLFVKLTLWPQPTHISGHVVVHSSFLIATIVHPNVFSDGKLWLLIKGFMGNAVQFLFPMTPIMSFCLYQLVTNCICHVGKSKGGPFGFGALFGLEEAVLCDPRREAAVLRCKIPYSIVRVGNLQDVPGMLLLTISGSTHMLWILYIQYLYFLYPNLSATCQKLQSHLQRIINIKNNNKNRKETSLVPLFIHLVKRSSLHFGTPNLVHSFHKCTAWHSILFKFFTVLNLA